LHLRPAETVYMCIHMDGLRELNIHGYIKIKVCMGGSKKLSVVASLCAQKPH